MMDGDRPHAEFASAMAAKQVIVGRVGGLAWQGSGERRFRRRYDEIQSGVREGVGLSKTSSVHLR